MSFDNEDPPRTWWQRHALSVMGGVMLAMFALVIAVQVGC